LINDDHGHLLSKQITTNYTELQTSSSSQTIVLVQNVQNAVYIVNVYFAYIIPESYVIIEMTCMINYSLFLFYNIDVKLAYACCWLYICWKLDHICFTFSLSTIFWLKDYINSQTTA